MRWYGFSMGKSFSVFVLVFSTENSSGHGSFRYLSFQAYEAPEAHGASKYLSFLSHLEPPVDLYRP